MTFKVPTIHTQFIADLKWKWGESCPWNPLTYFDGMEMPL